MAGRPGGRAGWACAGIGGSLAGPDRRSGELVERVVRRRTAGGRRVAAREGTGRGEL